MQKYTFKTKQTTVEERDVEVTLPYFCKKEHWGCDLYYALLSKNHLITVRLREGFAETQTTDFISQLTQSDFGEAKPISLEEFEAAYVTALGRINSFTLPVQEEQAA